MLTANKRAVTNSVTAIRAGPGRRRSTGTNGVSGSTVGRNPRTAFTVLEHEGVLWRPRLDADRAHADPARPSEVPEPRDARTDARRAPGGAHPRDRLDRARP